MPNRKRRAPWLRQCCYHVSHNCYSGVRVFRFAYAREQALKRLREMKDKYQVKFLNYLIHPNGYRLLLVAKEPARVSKAIQFFNTVTTTDYAIRRRQEGRIWKGRYNIMLVGKGPPAIRCSLDMDFAMLREMPDEIFHPLLWKHSGHLELSGVRKRYRVIDRGSLAKWFIDAPWLEFREWYIAASNGKWNSGEVAEETWWDEAMLVADKHLCETVAQGIPEPARSLRVYPNLKSVPGMEGFMCWTITMSRKRKREFILSLAPK